MSLGFVAKVIFDLFEFLDNIDKNVRICVSDPEKDDILPDRMSDPDKMSGSRDAKSDRLTVRLTKIPQESQILEKSRF